ncbi:MAG: copper chaperone PCu(A)C [Alphaproteobacteria bacterium]
MVGAAFVFGGLCLTGVMLGLAACSDYKTIADSPSLSADATCEPSVDIVVRFRPDEGSMFPDHPDVPHIAGAWARLSPAQGQPDAVYFTIFSSTDEVLNGASSPVAERIEIQVNENVDGFSGMTSADSMPIFGGVPRVFFPTGPRLMLFGVDGFYREGDVFPITFRFESGHEIQVSVAVGEPDHGIQVRSMSPEEVLAHRQEVHCE